MASFEFGDIVKKLHTTRPLVVLSSRVRDGVEEIKVMAEADRHPWWCKAGDLVRRPPAEAGEAGRYQPLLLLCARLALAQGFEVSLQDDVLRMDLPEGGGDWPLPESGRAAFQAIVPYPAKPKSAAAPTPVSAAEPAAAPAPGLPAPLLAYVENRFGQDIRIAVEQLAAEGTVTATTLQATRIKNFLESHGVAFRYQPTGQHSARLTTALPLELKLPEGQAPGRTVQA